MTATTDWEEELDYSDETEAEREARIAVETELDELSQETVDSIVDKVLVFTDELSGHPLYPYQRPFARRIVESLIIGDGATITALFSRQSGKSETVADIVATCMILFPILAKIYPDLMGKFKEGLWVGAFAPVDDQADTLFGRIVSRLTSERAIKIMADPDIDERITGKGRTVTLRRGSLVRRQTAHPRATIEGRTYHLILIDECFPAGTPVLTQDGWVPIDEIVNGDRRDWIAATQGADGRLEWGYVRTAYRTPRRGRLVRVDHEHGSIYCTADHPFVVGNERVAASALTPGTELFLVPGADTPGKPDHGSVRESEAADVLAGLPVEAQGPDPRGEGTPVPGWDLRTEGRQGEAEPEGLRAHEGEQPDALRRDSGESGGDAAGDRPSTEGSGRERPRSHRAPADAPASTGAGLGRRVCHRVWRRTEEGRPADALQARPGEPGPDARGGAGRRLTRNAGAPGSRPSQGGVLARTRVVRVEVLEPGSPELAQFSDGGDYVYTLEIDSASHTYVAQGILVGNCQGADERVVNKSIGPMGASTNATMVFTGTPTYTKGVFYKTIQLNKRQGTRRGARQNHFEADWREAAKSNPNYGKFVKKEMLRIGEDSDEFKLSYKIIWLLQQGQFTTSERLDELGDKSMQIVHAWHKTPVLVGIDPARKQDSTVVTVVWVDWDRPDEFGVYDHRILNWLDLSGLDWETQYYRIVEFLANYLVLAIGVDEGGVGDVVIDRLRVLMPHTEIIPRGSQRPEQSARWKHLMNLMDRGKLAWPAHAKTRRLKVWRRFRQQMEDLQKDFQGPYLLAEAPNEADAHDDYADSLAIALSLTVDAQMPEVEQSESPFTR